MKIFEFKENDTVSLPDGSHIFHVEYYHDYELIEVWASVPDSSVIASTQHSTESIAKPDYRGPNLLAGPDVSDLPKPGEVSIEDLAMEETEGGEVFFLDNSTDNFNE